MSVQSTSIRKDLQRDDLWIDEWRVAKSTNLSTATGQTSHLLVLKHFDIRPIGDEFDAILSGRSFFASARSIMLEGTVPGGGRLAPGKRAGFEFRLT